MVTESFLPTLNGVTTSVCRILEHLRRRGHHAVVVCPGPAPDEYAGYPVVAVPALNYRQFPVGLPVRLLVRRALAAHLPDVVHLASPFVLGAAGLSEARRLGVPAVAVYQTDVARYSRRYGATASAAAWRWLRHLHERAAVTLAPSTAALGDLTRHGVPRTVMWARGVDADRFTPDRRRTPAATRLRSRLAPDGETVVGYVGRLAPEKRVERLAALAGAQDEVPGGVRLAVVGDGPSRAFVERALAVPGMPPTTLLGRLDGDALADAYAAFDVFVHTGTEETFGQTLQEAMASGLPVVAPAAGGPLDIVCPGLTGELYPAEDDAALRRAVLTLARRPGLRHRYGALARELVLPRSWETLGDELIEHYRRAIAGGAPATTARRAS